MATKDELLSDVLKLPVQERAELAHKLLLSLEAEEVGGESAWEEELDRRAREVIDGAVKTVPWSEVEARVSARLKQR
ncbi:addiction module protein [Hyalangium versicolor]|uniref:addiction module protein n=1 Tax=Hyalangium versicolor TaxID=2861190 RepID=UPI001CD017A8|nr:addiction module protein [Hyalangium versicolor]